ncbi:formin-J-like [Hylaeus volcanicus]|uniref:formin-J-like n=1 Tax=Hylaeus volcanicus TaxID=313075 RepID=UPI0023B836EF|nr:formin-J-like [Hylaeus volcanicus]
MSVIYERNSLSRNREARGLPPFTEQSDTLSASLNVPGSIENENLITQSIKSSVEKKKLSLQLSLTGATENYPSNTTHAVCNDSDEPPENPTEATQLCKSAPPQRSTRRPPPPPPLRRSQVVTESSKSTDSSELNEFIIKIPKPPLGVVSRRIQWQQINKSKLSCSLWNRKLLNNISYEKIKNKSTFLDINYDIITSLFFEKVEINAKSALTPSSARNSLRNSSDVTSGKTPVVSILDAKRRQNIEICLKGLGLLDDITPLIRTVIDLSLFQKDFKESASCACLTAESLQLVLSLYPTKQEEELLRHASSNLEKNMVLGKAEIFLLKLMDIPYFCERAQCCLIRLTLVDEINEILHSLQLLRHLVEKILETLQNGGLRSILDFILHVGNYLNYGYHKGGFLGFSLEFLPQIKHVRSVDNSTTLLGVLANVIQEQKPLIWKELQTIVSFSQNVSALWLREAETTLKTTRKQLELVSSQLLKMQNNTLFVKIFSKFNTTGEALVKVCEQEAKTVNDSLIQLTRICGEREETITMAFTLINYLKSFCKDLFLALDKNLESKKRIHSKLHKGKKKQEKSIDVLKSCDSGLNTEITLSTSVSQKSREDLLEDLQDDDIKTEIIGDRNVDIDEEVHDKKVQATEDVNPVIESQHQDHPIFLPTNNNFSTTRYYEQFTSSHISKVKDPIFVRPIFPPADASCSPNEVKQINLNEENQLHTYTETPHQLTLNKQGLKEKKLETAKSTPKVPRLVLDQLLNCLGDKNDQVATARNVTCNNNTQVQFKKLETSNHYNLATSRGHLKNFKNTVPLTEKFTKKTPSLINEKPKCFVRAKHAEYNKLQQELFTSSETKTTTTHVNFMTNLSKRPPNSIPQGTVPKDSRQSFLEKYYAKQSDSISTTTPSPSKAPSKHNLFSFSSLKKTALTSKKSITRKLERLV